LAVPREDSALRSFYAAGPGGYRVIAFPENSEDTPRAREPYINDNDTLAIAVVRPWRPISAWARPPPPAIGWKSCSRRPGPAWCGRTSRRDNGWWSRKRKAG